MPANADPADVLRRLHEAAEKEALYKQIKEQCKEELSALHQFGVIPDLFISDGLQAKVCKRTTWRYSPAVKQLQQHEQLEGIAEQSVSSYWRVSEASDG